MNRLLQELKTRARLRLNARRRESMGTDLQLRDCLNAVAADVGFTHWAHARQVLGGSAIAGDDQGSFWYAPGCSGLLSHWYPRYDLALEGQSQGVEGVLFPFRRQFVLAGPGYLKEIGLDPDSPALAGLSFDLVASAGSPDWLTLAWQRLIATRPGQAP